MWKKVYTQILDGLFWIQQVLAWMAIFLVWAAWWCPPRAHPDMALVIEDIVFFMGTIVMLSIPLFLLAVLLRLFRGPGLSILKHTLSIFAPLFMATHLFMFYAGLHY